MDKQGDVFHYVSHLPRQVAHALPLRAFGFSAAKREWLDQVFNRVGFSFVVHGRGVYREDGREWLVEGPCVLRQRPGRHYQYGPNTVWEEFFLTYEADCERQFAAGAWAGVEMPVLRLADADLLRLYGRRLLELADRLGTFGAVDRLDQLGEELLLEVLVASRQPASRSRDERLQAARAWIEAHSAEYLNFDRVAERHGMSGRSFRRRWLEQFGVTPGTYLLNLRLRQACALLLGSRLPVGEIALQAGFGDAHYFARRFRQAFGDTPLGFRRSGGLAAGRPGG